MTKPSTTLSATWLALAAIAATGAAVPAMAQAQPTTTYDLPAQDLGTTLRAIGRQSRIEIIFADETVQGRRAPALRGTLTPEQAVGQALAGSGLTADMRDGAILVRLRPGTEAPSADQGGEVTITGTHIRGAATASPLTVATRQSLVDAGITDMATFSRMLPQNWGGGQNPGVAGGGDQGGYSNINNSTELNLRGLGADATLTLLNGHRLAYDAVFQGVDISAIPIAAIDRVEIITDGASALYGSDAIGGVANFMLRRDFDGLETSAKLGTATQGGDVTQQYDAVTGARWTGGGFMIAAQYDHNSPLTAADRAITQSLNGAQTLIEEQSQVSLILTGHQQIAAPLSFELDAEFMDRSLHKTNAFTTDTPVTVNGLINHPTVRSFAVTPSLRLKLFADWEATLSGTHSQSLTVIRAQNIHAGNVNPQRLRYDDMLDNVETGANGTLFDLPGGPVRLALGGGYRDFQLGIYNISTAGGILKVTKDAHESRGSWFGYGELNAALVGAANAMPLVEKLDLSGAIRYESYHGIERVATPKLGLIYAPHRDITMKVSWGRSFKIPTLYQSNQIPVAGLLPSYYFDPQPNPPLASDATVLLLGGGNPHLRAERATTWTGTLELKPAFARGLTLSGSFFHINYRNRIASPINDPLGALADPTVASFVKIAPSTAEVLAIVNALPQAISNATDGPFDPSKVGAIINESLQNGARDRVQGVDLAADYQLTFSDRSKLGLTATASYLDDDRQLIRGEGFIDNSGVIFTAPHWRGRAGADWDRGRFQVSSYVNYTGAVRDNRLASIGKMSAFTTIDLSAALRTGEGHGIGRNIEFRLSALNLLGRMPQRIVQSDPTDIPFDSTNQSAIGRFVSLSVSKAW